MDLLESVVVYDGLPVSSGGAHGLGRIAPSDAFREWMGFLDLCAEASPIECWFDLPRTPDLIADSAVRRAIEEQFPARAGRYAVPSHQVSGALSLFESFEPLPVNRWGMAPVWLCFTADLRLRSPTSSELWPEQDPARFGEFRTPGGVLLGSSSTRLFLQAKRSMGLILSLPLASDSELAVALPWLQNALPMRLSAKHWTRWTVTTNGASYRPSKISDLASYLRA